MLGADVGRVIAGSLDAGRQRAGLRQGQIPRVHAEISLSRRLNAVGTVAEIDVVQIHGQNVVLAHAAFQLPCQPDFLGLSGKGLLRAQMALTDQLHGDGAGPLRVAALPDVGRQRAEEPHHVHAVMAVKAQILRRQKYVPRLLGNVVEGDDHPVLTALDGHDKLAIAVVHAARLGRGGDATHIQRLPVGHVQHKEPRRSSGHAQKEQHQQRRPQGMPPHRQAGLIAAGRAQLPGRLLPLPGKPLRRPAADVVLPVKQLVCRLLLCPARLLLPGLLFPPRRPAFPCRDRPFGLNRFRLFFFGWHILLRRFAVWLRRFGFFDDFFLFREGLALGRGRLLRFLGGGSCFFCSR